MSEEIVICCKFSIFNIKYYNNWKIEFVNLLKKKSLQIKQRIIKAIA